jgi:hypothetical protein
MSNVDPLFTLTVDGSSGAPELELRMAQILSQAFEVVKERQRKYGSNNIARRGAKGVIVRLDDKLARLEQLANGKGGNVTDETMLDTCIDIINYSGIAHICLSGKWPPYEN